MLQTLTQYYGIDLAAMVVTFVGIYYLGNKKRSGFIMALVGNVLWLVFGILLNSFGVIVANLMLAVLNVRGYSKWRK